jgi:hypothetical protein
MKFIYPKLRDLFDIQVLRAGINPATLQANPYPTGRGGVIPISAELFLGRETLEGLLKKMNIERPTLNIE